MKKLYLLSCLFVLIASIVHAAYTPLPSSAAANIFINASTGDDNTGNGTSGTPYNTFARALRAIPVYLDKSYTITDTSPAGTTRVEAIDTRGHYNGDDRSLVLNYVAQNKIALTGFVASLYQPQEFVHAPSAVVIVGGHLSFSMNLPTTIAAMTAGVNGSTTTWPISSGTGFSNGDFVQCDLEIAQIVSGGGTTSLTVTRAQQSTSASVHNQGCAVVDTTTSSSIGVSSNDGQRIGIYLFGGGLFTQASPLFINGPFHRGIIAEDYSQFIANADIAIDGTNVEGLYAYHRGTINFLIDAFSTATYTFSNGVAPSSPSSASFGASWFGGFYMETTSTPTVYFSALGSNIGLGMVSSLTSSMELGATTGGVFLTQTGSQTSVAVQGTDHGNFSNGLPLNITNYSTGYLGNSIMYIEQSGACTYNGIGSTSNISLGAVLFNVGAGC